jgi:hypothetical protein
VLTRNGEKVEYLFNDEDLFFFMLNVLLFSALVLSDTDGIFNYFPRGQDGPALYQVTGSDSNIQVPAYIGHICHINFSEFNWERMFFSLFIIILSCHSGFYHITWR